MQLLYLWIKNKRDFICKQGMNFGGKFIFHYEVEAEQLNVEENPSYIENFFEVTDFKTKSVVANISAIIGENGAGKTTVLNFIKNNLVYGMGGIEEEAIIVIEDGQDKYVYHHQNIKITDGNFKSYNFILKTYALEEKSGVIIYPSIDSSVNTSVIYFSNIFDHAIDSGSYGNLINISTNYLTKNDKVRMLENKRVNSNASEVELHRIQETHRQIQFLRNVPKSRERLPFLLPKGTLGTFLFCHV